MATTEKRHLDRLSEAFERTTRRTRLPFVPGEVEWFESGDRTGAVGGDTAEYSPRLAPSFQENVDEARQMENEQAPMAPAHAAAWPTRPDRLKPLGQKPIKLRTPEFPWPFFMRYRSPGGPPTAYADDGGYIRIEDEPFYDEALVPKGRGPGKGRVEPAEAPAGIAVRAWADRLTSRPGSQRLRTFERFGEPTVHVEAPEPALAAAIDDLAREGLGTTYISQVRDGVCILSQPGFGGTTNIDALPPPPYRPYFQAFNRPASIELHPVPQDVSGYRAAAGLVPESRLDPLMEASGPPTDPTDSALNRILAARAYNETTYRKQVRDITLKSEDPLGALAPGGCSTMSCKAIPRGVTGGVTNPRTPVGTGSPLTALEAGRPPRPGTKGPPVEPPAVKHGAFVTVAAIAGALLLL